MSTAVSPRRPPASSPAVGRRPWKNGGPPVRLGHRPQKHHRHGRQQRTDRQGRVEIDGVGQRSQGNQAKRRETDHTPPIIKPAPMAARSGTSSSAYTGATENVANKQKLPATSMAACHGPSVARKASKAGVASRVESTTTGLRPTGRTNSRPPSADAARHQVHRQHHAGVAFGEAFGNVVQRQEAAHGHLPYD